MLESHSDPSKFFNQAQTLLCILSFEGHFIHTNPAWENMLGYEREVLGNGLFSELIHPDDKLTILPHLRDPSYHTKTAILSARYRHYNGNYRDLLWHITPVPAENVFYVTGIPNPSAADENRTPLYQALQRTRDFVTTLIQTSPVFFIALTPDGKIIIINDTMLDTLGYSLDEVVGHDYLSTLVAESERAVLNGHLQKLSQQQDAPSMLESGVLTQQGKRVLVEWHYHAVHDVEGWSDYLFGVGINVHERNQVKQQLYLFKTIVENSHEAISIAQPDGKLLYTNEAFQTLLNADGKHQSLSHYPVYFSQTGQEEFTKQVLPAVCEGNTWEGILEAKNKWGEFFSIWVRFDSVQDKNGKPLYLLGLMHDVSEQQVIEDALRYEHEQYETIFNAAPLMIIYKDQESHLIRANQYARQILKKESDSEDSNTSLDLEYTSQYYADDQEVMATGQPKFGIIEKTKGNFFETDKIPYRDASGNIRGVIVFAMDISEYIQTERVLNHEREQYETIFNSAPLMIIYKDRDSRIIRINPYAAKRLGSSPDVLTGVSHYGLGLEYTEHYYADDQEVMQTGQPKLGIIEKSRGRFFRTDKLPYRDASGHILGVIVFAVDITERLEVEYKLKENEERLSSLVENIPILMTAYSAEGKLLMWNPEAEHITGYKAEDMLDNHQALQRLYPQDSYRQYQEKVLLRGELKQWEAEIACCDGSRKKIRWHNWNAKLPTPEWHCWIMGEVLDTQFDAQDFIQANALIVSFLDSQTQPACVTDEHGRFVYLNVPFCQLHGHDSSNDLLNRHFTYLIPKASYSELLRQYFSFLAQEKLSQFNGEYQAEHSNGQPFDVKFCASRTQGIQQTVFVVWLLDSLQQIDSNTHTL